MNTSSCHMKDVPNNLSFTNKLVYVAFSCTVLTYVKVNVTGYFSDNFEFCGSKGLYLLSHICGSKVLMAQ